MAKPNISGLVALLLTSMFAIIAESRASDVPQTVEVRSGTLTLRALLWRPTGKGPFPAILLNHGSGRSREELERLGPYEQQANILGPVFARHGYVFLYLFRRGVGLSANQGINAVDVMNSEFAAHGQYARNTLQLRLLENEEMSDALSGLAFLRALPEVDAREVATIGHSFGGSLTLLLAERDPNLRAVVIFSGAGYSWDLSAPLRARLLEAVAHVTAPILFIHAANDFSLSAGKALDARLEHLGRSHRLKLYPPVGHTPEDGHSFLYLGMNTWEPDVFAFLDEHMRR
jgi:carboxymethylenebutenolidase